MNYDDYSEEVSPKSIRPLHEVRDEAKLLMLVEAMQAGGWTGRPLLVVDEGGGDYVALTGSHRLAAALESGLSEVPVVVVPQCERLTVEPVLGGVDVCFDGVRLSEDDERLAAMEELGHEVAAHMMRVEMVK